jgi:hypothetical protein
MTPSCSVKVVVEVAHVRPTQRVDTLRYRLISCQHCSFVFIRLHVEMLTLKLPAQEIAWFQGKQSSNLVRAQSFASLCLHGKQWNQTDLGSCLYRS